MNADHQHQAFLRSPRRHVLNITNHGVHGWQVVPGLPDTGGQNVFVNQLSDALVALGFKVTVANRGGYPHPVTGQPRQGLDYRDAHSRILYLRDSRPAFVRKEQMDPLTGELARDLTRSLEAEGLPVDLLLTHYWDGAEVGRLYNEARPRPAPHAWVPHSLGTVKKRNMPPETWDDLRVDRRIQIERQLAPRVDHAAATSRVIQQALVQDLGLQDPLYLPPCVDPQRFCPREVAPDHPVWALLAERSGLDARQVQRSRIISEVSRTDRTKRKEVLIRAFGQLPAGGEGCLLAVTIDDDQQPLAGELRRLISQLDLQRRVAVLGSIWELLPALYAISEVYCTPSVMEGFGMSAQEAAACGVPVVASALVPFAVEHLRGEPFEELQGGLQLGAGAIVVPPDDVDGFARALSLLLDDDTLRRQMGRRAQQITVPSFTWAARTSAFLRRCGLTLADAGGEP